MVDKPVGVVGLGNMGAGIAANVAGSGRAVLAWDACERVRRAAAEGSGLRVAPLTEIGRECDTVLFVVPTNHEIEQCLEGEAGLLAEAREGLVLVDLTTSDPQRTRRLAASLAKRGIAYLDAGMSGGRAGAQAGTLSLMVGGDAAVLRRVEPLLRTFANAIHHLGASGAGHTMKLVHQIMCHANFLAACEALALGEKAGLRLAQMLDVVNASNGRSYASEVRFPRHIVTERWDGGSRVYNLHKDLSMAYAMARDLAGDAAMCEATLRYLEAALKRGMADQDFTLLYREFGELLGTAAR